MIDAIRTQLIGEDLSGVTFVRDYLQLQFNPPPSFNVYSRCDVLIGGENFTFGDSYFANAVISCIGKNVSSVIDDDVKKYVLIHFDDESKIALHYRSELLQGPEAIEFFGRDNLQVIWP